LEKTWSDRCVSLSSSPASRSRHAAAASSPAICTESSCDKDWPTKSQLVACLDSKDRQVWATEEPATLDLYDSFARQRDALARDLDRKEIDEDQYLERLRKLKNETRAQMAARRGQKSEPDQAPAQP
jgi:flagellar motility protein MotE (MotC chaperone)